MNNNEKLSPQELEEKQIEQKQQQEQMMNQILSQVLDQEARARLSTIKLAKPEKGAQIESLLVNMARSGQLRAKIGQDELVGLLERVSGKERSSVKFVRRNMDSDDEEEDYGL